MILFVNRLIFLMNSDNVLIPCCTLGKVEVNIDSFLALDNMLDNVC